jgi:cation:H+ antiporter
MVLAGMLWHPFPHTSVGNILYFISGIVLLWVSGKYLIRGGVALGQVFRLSPLVIGITVISIGTSAPELLVSIKAAVTGHPDIAVGNVVGSNIANIGLVLGLTVLFMPILIDVKKMMWDSLAMVGVTAGFIAISCTHDRLSRPEGLIMLVLIVGYVLWLLFKAPKEMESLTEEESRQRWSWWVALTVVIISSFGLALAADYVVLGASGLALSMGVSERVISLSMVALGTSLPELTASLAAVLKKEADMSVGNILGSNVFNLFGIMGVTALIHPVTVNKEILSFDVVFLFIMALLLVILGWLGRELSRKDGMILLVLYVLYILIVFRVIGSTVFHFDLFYKLFCS